MSVTSHPPSRSPNRASEHRRGGTSHPQATDHATPSSLQLQLSRTPRAGTRSSSNLRAGDCSTTSTPATRVNPTPDIHHRSTSSSSSSKGAPDIGHLNSYPTRHPTPTMQTPGPDEHTRTTHTHTHKPLRRRAQLSPTHIPRFSRRRRRRPPISTLTSREQVFVHTNHLGDIVIGAVGLAHSHQQKL